MTVQRIGDEHAATSSRYNRIYTDQETMKSACVQRTRLMQIIWKRAASNLATDLDFILTDCYLTSALYQSWCYE